jgi:hypothetical protein
MFVLALKTAPLSLEAPTFHLFVRYELQSAVADAESASVVPR